MKVMGHPGYDDDSQYPDDEPTSIQKLARIAGRLADVVVNRKALTLAQKDEVVVVLRKCERQLLEEPPSAAARLTDSEAGNASGSATESSLRDRVAHLTEERDYWKRRAEDAEGRIGNASA